MESSVDYLSNLPIEIFLLICSFLDAKKSLPRLKCVCKRIYDILGDDLVWKSRIAGRWYPNEKGIEVDWKEACTCIEVESSYLRQPMTCDEMIFRKAHDSDIDALHILEDYKTLMTGSRDGDIKIWNINREDKALEKSHSIAGAHGGWVWRIASERSSDIYSCSFDHSLKYWNLSDENLATVWTLDFKKPVMSIKVVDENLVAAGLHSEVALVDRRLGTAVKQIFKDNYIKLGLAMIGPHTLVSSGANKKICIMDLRNDKEDFITFDFGKERPVTAMHLAVQKNLLYVCDGLSRIYAADITKSEPVLVRKYFPEDGSRERVIGMHASPTSLVVGVNYNKQGHLAFWRTKSSHISDQERYPVMKKVGEMHNIGSFNELCSMHYRDGMLAVANIMENDVVCLIPKEF